MKSKLHIVGFIFVGLLLLSFFTKPLIEGHGGGGAHGGHGHGGHGRGRGHGTSYVGGYSGSSGWWYPFYGYYDYYAVDNAYVIEMPYGYGYFPPRNAWMNI